MYDFTYRRPVGLAEALRLLADDPESKALAGGMTIVPAMKHRLMAPTMLLDIGRLDELRGIEVADGAVSVGAATTHRDVMRDERIRSLLPGLAALAECIGDPQVRVRGTLGGSLANNDPAADYPAAVLGLAAVIVTDRREIAADDFFQGMFATALEPGELILRVRFPVVGRCAYAKFRHPASGYAMTGVFVAVHDAGVRVAVTGAAASVFRWDAAEAALADRFAVDALDALALPADGLNADMHAPAEYRAHLVSVMTRRAVRQCEALQ